MNPTQQSDELHEKLEVIIGLLAEILHQTYEHRVGNHTGPDLFVLPRKRDMAHVTPIGDDDIPF